MTTKEIISKNIVGLRKKNHMTQQDLAEKLYYSDKAISKWERGESLPDAEMLANIASLFKVDINYLFVDHNYSESTLEEELKLKKRSRTIKIIFALTISAIILTLFEIVIASFVPTLNDMHYLVGALLFIVPTVEFIILIVSLILNREKYTRLLLSLSVWSLAIAFYYFFIDMKLIYIYAIAVVVQIAIIVFPRIDYFIEKSAAKENKKNSKL